MIRITRQADYGIVVMTRMAREPERLFKAQELAAECFLPAPMVSKILKPLARSGLLDSQRGAAGGYSLAKPTESITVADIITALDGPIAITECIDGGGGECSNESFCSVRGNWQRINTVIQQALNSISLSEMTSPLPASLLSRMDVAEERAELS